MKVYLDNCCYNRPYDDQNSLSVSLETLGIEHFDYTKWQREHFDNMDLRTFVGNAATYAKSMGK